MSAIFEYVRDKNRQPIGVVVACKKKNKVRFGWSLCMVSPSKRLLDQRVTPDRFSKENGLLKATCRAEGCGFIPDEITESGKKTKARFYSIPHNCRQALRRLKDRAERYYKDVGSKKKKSKKAK